MSNEVSLTVASKGDAVSTRELPGTTVQRGWGWVRTVDDKRSVYVVHNPMGVWVVQDVEVLES